MKTLVQRLLLLVPLVVAALLLAAPDTATSRSDWGDVLKRLGPPPSDKDLAVPAGIVAAIEAPAVAPASPVVAAIAAPVERMGGPVATPETKPEVAVSMPAPAALVAVDTPVSLGHFVSADSFATTANSDLYVEINYQDEPLPNVLRRLARATGENFIMPKLEATPVSLSQKGNPFVILKGLIESQGMGLTKRGDSWLITALDRVKLVPQTYALKHIHLDREFSFRDAQIGSNGTGSNGQSSGSNFGGGNNSSNNNSMNGGFGGNNSGGGNNSSGLVTNEANLAPPRSVNERFTGKNNLLLETLENILETGLANPLDSDAKININDKEVAAAPKKSKALYTYDPDSNRLLVICTEQQHAWVAKWLETVDQPTHNVEITVQFISTGGSDGDAFGVDWSGGTNGVGFGNGIPLTLSGARTATSNATTSDPIVFGPLNNLRGPSNAILSSEALNLTLKALSNNSNSKTTRKQIMVTLTNREAVIDNTQNQPVVLQNSSGSTSTGGGLGGSTTTASASSIANEKIGTVTRILPKIIDGDLINLSVTTNITNLLRTQIINGNEYPIISETGSTTELKLRSGYSVVIGGLESMFSSETIKKVPLLGDVPFFGFAFKDTVRGNTVSHISLIITVNIIDEAGNRLSPADGLATK